MKTCDLCIQSLRIVELTNSVTVFTTFPRTIGLAHKSPIFTSLDMVKLLNNASVSFSTVSFFGS